MNIIKAIKAWWKPEAKEASTKATVRFKNGVVIDTHYPDYAGLVMRKAIDGFVNSNRDLEAEARLREASRNRDILRVQQHLGACCHGGGGGNSGQAQSPGLLGSNYLGF